MKRSQLLAAEAELVALEERFADLKSKRKVCGECGRIKPDSKLEKQILGVKAELRDKRAAFREARAKFDG